MTDKPVRIFPDGDDLMDALLKSGEPMTTAEVHIEAQKNMGKTMPHHHGMAGTMLRLERMYQNRLIHYRLNEHGARVWFVMESDGA